jgi:GT2 family glycosyltransferase
VQGLVLTGDGGVNTAGNQAQYLGFSWAPLGVAPSSTAPYEIPTASGASLLVERELFLHVGGFWEELFLYQEDFDLCWRLRLGGRRIIAAPGARSHHQYEFSRNRGKYYHLERGRHLVLFANYEAGTLLRLAPALLATDLALLAVAARDGWLGEQLSALASVVRSLPVVARQRRIVQAQRTVRDSEILRVLSSELDQAAFGRVATFAAPFLERYRALVGLG